MSQGDEKKMRPIPTNKTSEPKLDPTLLLRRRHLSEATSGTNRTQRRLDERRGLVGAKECFALNCFRIHHTNEIISLLNRSRNRLAERKSIGKAEAAAAGPGGPPSECDSLLLFIGAAQEEFEFACAGQPPTTECAALALWIEAMIEEYEFACGPFPGN